MGRVRLRLVGLALLLILAACGGDASGSPTTFRTVSPSEAAEIIGEGRPDLVVLDLRTPEEFNAGHLPGAVNLDFSDPAFAAGLAALDRQAPYVLYCWTGMMSADVREMMRDLGFVEVYEIEGGIVAWVEAGGPLDGYSPGL